MRRLGGLGKAAIILLAPAVALASAGSAGAQSAVLTPAAPIDGPSADIVSLSGLSVSRDGSGGLVYLKNVAGVPHVFVSRLVGGTFAAPEQLDPSLAGGSSQPVIAAGDNGVLLVAFINGGQLYAVARPGAATPYGAATVLAAGASDPSLQISIHGKGYLAFTTTGAGGHDVRAAYYHAGQWALEPTPLDAAPANDAGVGAGRPRVAACGDGVGIVVWGEAGHVYARRVWGTSPSVVYEQADVPSVSGWHELSADQPEIATGDDSSYANVVWREVVTNGSAQQSRVLQRKLRGSRYEAFTMPDGLSTPGPEGAVSPQITEGGYSYGFITSVRDGSNQVFATLLTAGGISQGLARVDTLPNASAPYAVTAMNGLFSGLVAWQHDPGPLGTPDIRFRLSAGKVFGPELLASSSTLGPTAAARGLATAGDVFGDVVIAWVQGDGASTRIVAAQQWRQPGGFAPAGGSPYATTARPVIRWFPARQQWGSLSYQVAVDGVLLAQTRATSVRLGPLTDGPHTWQVTAVNQAGAATAARPVPVFVDTVRPTVNVSLRGSLRTGSLLRLFAHYADPPPAALPASDASGVSSVAVDWGDGTTATFRQGIRHSYRRPGRYGLTVRVTDNAGNVTALAQSVRVTAPPKPLKPRKRKK